MNSLAVKRFLKEAGLNKQDLREMVRDSSYTLRTRKQPKQIVQDTFVENYAPKIQNNSKRMSYPQPEYDPLTFRSQLLTFNKSKGREIIEWQNKNIQMLETLYERVAKQGGIVQLLSKGGWEQVCYQFRRKNEYAQNQTDEQILSIYLDHLIQFQFMSVGTPLILKKGVKMHRTLKYGIFIPQSNKAFLQSRQIQKDYLDQEIVVLRNAAKTLNIENVTLQRINNDCGDQDVELRIQNPLDFGFNSFKLTNKGDKMTIREYCEYQKYFEDQEYCRAKFGDKLKGGKVFFAVNFQPAAGNIVNSIKQKLKDTLFGWSQPNDMLSYLEQHINGCTNPQFYLKVRGVWTGGHQQNVNMCAININHGPSDSQWYTVPGEEVERLRRLLKEKFKQDLYQHEGLWFEKINWFIEQGIQITRIIQKAGDMVISGPGTLHWVRGFGVSMHSAWNIFPESYKMLASAYHRQQQNQKIKFRKSNIIPLKTLTIKHIQHSYQTLSIEERYVLCIHLSKWLSEQQTQLQSIKLHYDRLSLKLESKKLQEHQSYCQVCHQQILVYYVHNVNENGILCLNCSVSGQFLKGSSRIYHKTNPKELFSFISQAVTNNLVVKELKYCSGQHIGKQCMKSTKLLKFGFQKTIKLEDKGIQTEQSKQSLKRSSDRQFYQEEEKSKSTKKFHKDEEKEQKSQQNDKKYKNKDHSEERTGSHHNEKHHSKGQGKKYHDDKSNNEKYRDRNHDSSKRQDGDYRRKDKYQERSASHNQQNGHQKQSNWNENYKNRNDYYAKNESSNGYYNGNGYKQNWTKRYDGQRDNNDYSHRNNYKSSKDGNYNYNRYENNDQKRQNGDKYYQKSNNHYQNGNGYKNYNNYGYKNKYTNNYDNQQKWQRKDYKNEEVNQQSAIKNERKRSLSEISY